jgi:exocyst complex component 4
MTDRSYVCDVEPEEPDEYVLSLTTQMSRMDDEVSSYVPPIRRSYAFGGVCGIAARCAIANLGRMKAINHLGVRQVRVLSTSV